MAVIFVGGSQRSGTTLLQTVLCQDKQVNPLIQEAKYLRHLVSAYRFGKQTFKTETRDYFKDYTSFVAFNAQMVRTFLKNTRALFPDARHLVLREPHLTMLFPELGELLPGAKFICMVRDPRDAIASMVEVGKKLDPKVHSSDQMTRLFRSGDFAALSRHFLAFYQPLLKVHNTAFRRRVLTLRYEDLVSDPDRSIPVIRRFTGIGLKDFDAGAEPDTGRVDYRKLDRYKRAWASQDYARQITDARIGRYGEILEPAAIRTIEKECAGYLKQFRYISA